jgi:hypothetical protein
MTLVFVITSILTILQLKIWVWNFVKKIKAFVFITWFTNRARFSGLKLGPHVKTRLLFTVINEHARIYLWGHFILQADISGRLVVFKDNYVFSFLPQNFRQLELEPSATLS